MPRKSKSRKQKHEAKLTIVDSSHSEENESISDNSDNEIVSGTVNIPFEGPEYVDYDRIKDFKYKMTGDEKYVTVKCFFNGEKWLCPNPHAEELCNSIENWYMSTEYIKTRLIVMPLTVFDDVLYKMTHVENLDQLVLSEL